MINNLTYVVVDINEVNNIDYSQVQQTSAETIRKSLDLTKFILKYEGVVPSTVQTLDGSNKLITYDGKKYFTHPEILQIVATPEWTGTQSLLNTQPN